ncbi:MAG: 3-oxoacyl-ACP reductase [Gammaproteobacteria bacterium HGW-Gammaproteobacteria-14]|nr:MAG: 3-oxoacyl-ACP reductase [Gammaproteobacteria bacterium HGW-Gammaproteobacteria-14]
MSDVYQAIANSPVGSKIFSSLNLPIPVILERHSPGQASFISGDVIVGAAPGGKAITSVLATLKTAPQAKLHTLAGLPAEADVQKAGGTAGVNVGNYTASKEDKQKFKGLIFDATGIKNTAELRALYDFFHPLTRKLEKCGRIVVIGRIPENCPLEQRIAQRGLEGLIKSLGKEIKKASVANLIYVDEGAESQLASSLQFFLSPKAAYVSGQLVRVAAADFNSDGFDWNKPLTGKTVLVTGAARGIGAAIAEVIARDGAKVIVLDIPPMADDLKQVASRIGGVALEADITAADAPALISAAAKEHGGLDVIIHNAGVTRDKTMAGMPDKFWDMVIDINIGSEERINAQLLKDGTLNDGGRIVCVSSISGIAGNMGQTNYATSKAAVIGMVQGMAPELQAKNITINAVAPGFIETQMTAAIPFAIREAGRRMNSMSQGGQPVDVAETISYFASPASQGVTGNIVRVCGQSLIGA